MLEYQAVVGMEGKSTKKEEQEVGKWAKNLGCVDGNGIGDTAREGCGVKG